MNCEASQERESIVNGQEKYSMEASVRDALRTLQCASRSQVPEEIWPLVDKIAIRTVNHGNPYFPCPFKETETLAALKAVEAGLAAGIANLRYGQDARAMSVDLERVSCSLISAYVTTVNGFTKADPCAKSFIKDTDLLQAQSILYRRLSANLYETKRSGEYFHIHGSLDASKVLNSIGLESHRPDMTEYKQCIDLIEEHVTQYTVEELEKMNAKINQAGVTALKWEDFKTTKHGQVLLREPPWRVEEIEKSSPPAPFSSNKSASSKPQILAGVKVIEMCRIIAGPFMGRGLAEYGADVLKITSPNLSDVPFFQVDGNVGKHAAELDLRKPDDRQIFERLLQDADVILDGYRPGSLERLGYGPRQIMELTKDRGRGIVYVSENCFGHVGEWHDRPGWQQIADCVTGIAWLQGQFMGLEEPVVPPFPMSDYGTGCMGTVAALTGLYKRAKYGGSYHGTTSLCQFDILLLRLGTYSPEIQQRLRDSHNPDFFELRHNDSVDEVGKRALRSLEKLHPLLFSDELMHEAYSRGFKAPVKTIKPAVEIGGTWNGFLRSSRPNGFDPPSWDGWEVDEDMLMM
ncbi:alpha-methylacyl-CoA racemase [Aulographum hederae CBS 113979]|uniref:Alpha-methylacyl-CoA racemase n=1 Tax=Aulographum hederae CBS 113979 TaxID=1176131 RepID=A0A6G1GWD7_9PEZI|nr:alpha-methylacyl-CoA racemase [Aulographum hederae CBS 113979]